MPLPCPDPILRDRMAYEPLHHKYRPQTFAQLVGQEAIAATLTSALRQSRIAPAYLFCGPRGTGKTSSARILAKSLNCTSGDRPTPEPCGTCDICTSIVKGSALDIIEIDAASNTGVDNIRELIERAQFAPVQCRYKVYIIDEVHMLSTAAFNALLKTLEEPPARVVFVLATTDPQRVLPTIISRCQRFDFRRIPLGSMVTHLQAIAQQEQIDVEPEAVSLVAQISQGGLRDAESLLDQLSLADGSITAETVWELVGAVPERELLGLARAIADDSGVAVLDRARHLMDRGREPLIVLQNLASFFRDLLVAKTAPERRDLVAVTDETWRGMADLVQTLSLATILHAQQRLRESEVQVKSTSQPRLWLEVTLMGLLPANLALGQRDTEAGKAFDAPASAARSTGAKPTAQTSSPAALPRDTSPAKVAPTSDKSSVSPAAPTPELTSRSALEPALPPIEPEAPPSEVGRATEPPASAPLTSASASTPSADPPIAAPAASTPTGPSPTDLTQIWQDVLQHLRPPGTQALLHQHGRLLQFNGSAARVGVVSSPLMKMAEQRVKNIELAFEKALSAQVSITFQVTGQTTDVPAPLPAPTAEPALLPPRPQTPPAPREAPAPTPSPPPRAPAAPPAAPGQENPAAADPVPSAALPPLDDDSAVQAAKSFASMFNGQVIEWNEDLDFLPAQDSGKSSPASGPRPSRDVERGEPDIDVPF